MLNSNHSFKSNKLEGYLNKYYGKNTLRSFKKRWISFNFLTLNLDCFKNNTDKIPLESIDIKNSVLTINCNEDFSNNNEFIESFKKSFQIINNEKIWILEAESTKICINWLHNLQKLRNILNNFLNDKNEFDIKLLNDSDFRYVNSQMQYINNQQIMKNSSDLQADLDRSFNLENSSLNNSFEQLNTNASSSPQVKQHVLSTIFTKIRKNDAFKNKDSSQDLNPTSCHKCKELEDQIITFQDDLNAYETEMYGNKEVIKVLQGQIEQLIDEKETFEKLCKSFTSGKEDSLEELVKNTTELSKIKYELNDLKVKNSLLEDENKKLKDKVKKTDESVSLLQEMLQVKDQTVISLTNEIFDLEKSESLFSVKPSSTKNSSFQSYISDITLPQKESIKPQNSVELQKLQDSVEAFQAQNHFLNKEIIDLNENKKNNEAKLQKLELKCYEWEAKCCQIQSKLLSLLKEINYNSEESEKNSEECQDKKVDFIAQNKSIKLLVQRLLDENSLDIPISWRPGNKKKYLIDKSKNDTLIDLKNSSSNKAIIEYDDLGFQTNLTQENEYDDLFDNASSNKLTDSKEDLSLENETAQWTERWDNYILSVGNSQILNRSKELKLLLRSGVPSIYRPKIWKMCINMLIEHKKPLKDPNYYTNLVKENQLRSWNPSCKQIELDLLRTLPYNRHFESRQCDGISRLRNVLIAYSKRNPAVGYCQGMNRLAAVALLILNEEDAFWCLVAIIETIMPKDYYNQNLLGAHVDQYVLKDLIAEKLPKLHVHFEKHNIEISLFSWFLTCFVDNISVNIFLRIWDVFLFEGSKVLFRFALAFLKYHELALLSLNDSMLINQYLRVFGERTHNLKQLCNIAFNDLNPFRMSKLKEKRDLYRQVVTKELENLENLKKNTIKTYDIQFD